MLSLWLARLVRAYERSGDPASRLACGTAAGALSDRAGWPGVFAAWTAASVVGALLAFASARGVRKIGETGKN